MAAPHTLRISAPSLGADIVGELDNDYDLAIFRGIPYATVAQRWTHSKSRHFLEGTFTATEFGPRCNQGNGMVLVTGGTSDPVPGDDEFCCLNLNIAVPKEAIGEKPGSLPVMVWIHG
jgi:carboxylesterase type B